MSGKDSVPVHETVDEKVRHKEDAEQASPMTIAAKQMKHSNLFRQAVVVRPVQLVSELWTRASDQIITRSNKSVKTPQYRFINPVDHVHNSPAPMRQ